MTTQAPAMGPQDRPYPRHGNKENHSLSSHTYRESHS